MSQLTQLDANQVIKTVYDPDTQALKTNPAIVDTTVWLDGLAAGVDHTSTAVNVLSYRVVGVIADWASLDHVDGTLQFQGSLDNSLWDNIGSATTLSSASGHQAFSLVDEPYKYVRLVYSHGTNTTGTITAKYILRA